MGRYRARSPVPKSSEIGFGAHVDSTTDSMYIDVLEALDSSNVAK